MYRRQGRPRQNTHIFPAPSMGWIKNMTLLQADQRGAEVLDNIFPTAQGARMRRGSAKRATVGSAVKQVFTYEGIGGSAALYAATATAIYDVTAPADVDVAETPVMSLQTSGDWSTAHFSTSAGDYVIGVNGADPMFLNDGTDFQPVSDAAISDLAYTGLTGGFEIGLTVTGGTSGATAVIVGDQKVSATAGTLKVKSVAGGPFQAEAITDTGTGSATSSGAEASASSIAVTGVDTATLSQLWAHQRRLWFIEGGTMSAWYLATVSIGGAATEFPMGGLFEEGGALLFGASWSQDSGEGMDDMSIFVTTRGEVAVYAGTDPSSASTWSLQGLYKIGKPLSKNAWFRSAGDIQILTEDGIVSVTDAMRLSESRMLQNALSYPIEEAWRDAVANDETGFEFSVTRWPTQTMLVVGVPSLDGSTPTAYVANARTGAWCRYLGWDIRCSAVFDDRFYFGTNAGTILEGETTGADEGSVYAARWVPKFAEFGSPGMKYASLAGIIYRATQAHNFTFQGFSDYTVSDWKSTPDAQVELSGSVWGTGIWGTSTWGATADKTGRRVQRTVQANGFALAPGIQTSSGTVGPPDFEIASGFIQFEVGSPV